MSLEYVGDHGRRYWFDELGLAKLLSFANPIAAGVQTVLSVVGALNRRREQRDIMQRALGRLQIADVDAQVSVADAQWVVGTVRTAGLPGPAIDQGVQSHWYRTGDKGNLKARNFAQPVLLSAGPLASVDAMWVDDLPAPIRVSDAGRTLTTDDWAKPIRNLWFTPQDTLVNSLVGTGPLTLRAQAVVRHMDALLPGWRPTDADDGEIVYGDADDVVRSIFNSWLGELNSIRRSAELQWLDRRKVRKEGGDGGDVEAQDAVVRASLSLGASGDVFATDWARGTTPVITDGDRNAAPRMIQRVPGWRATDTFAGNAWAMVQHRFWTKPGTAEIVPRSRLPRLHFLCRGAGDFAGNAVDFVKWTYLQAGRSEADLDGLASESAHAGELLVLPPMTPNDPDDGSKPITGQQYLDVLYPDGLPAADVQSRVLTAVNALVAGPDNAVLRYGLDRVFTTSEIESGDAADIAAERIGGRIVEMPGKRVLIRTARRRSVVMDVGPEDLWERMQWKVASGVGRGYNALATQVEQDADQQWKPTEAQVVRNEKQVERDGLALQRRTARGVSSVVAARRQSVMLLDRDSYDKREALAVVRYGAASDPASSAMPSDTMRVPPVAGDDAALVEVQRVTRFRGRVACDVRELDADVYDDKFFVTPLERDPGPGGGGAGPDLGLSPATATFRNTVAGRVCDLQFTPGSDVTEIGVTATWRERVASEPPVADDVERYSLTVAAAARGLLLTHTVLTSEVAPGGTVPTDPKAEAHVFMGDDNRELLVELQPTGDGGAAGPVFEQLLIPSVAAAEYVTIGGVDEDKVLEGGAFTGWEVIIRDVRVVSGATLVASWDVGDTDPWQRPQSKATFTVSEPDEDTGGVDITIPNTFRLATGWTALTLAARTGQRPPYQYFAGPVIDINKYVEPKDATRRIDAPPTTKGNFDHEIVYTEEQA